jgi:5-methylcytosine-specific restriction enzyme A
MTAYLLAWNPKRWKWNELPELSNEVMKGKNLIRRWSCGNSKGIKKGDRFFLIRLGKLPKGIFASGIVVKEPYWDAHWERLETEKRALFVEIQFDTLIDPDKDVILPLEVLQQPPLSGVNWSTQISGIKISDEIAAELEKVWATFTTNEFISADEIEIVHDYPEGAITRVSVNAYERNPAARRKCIAHYGTNCSICGINFEKVYGEVGKGYIHVHHLVALSEIGKEYKTDPIKDLRPVCPNCHAMLHRKPSFTIDELANIVRKQQNRG